MLTPTLGGWATFSLMPTERAAIRPSLPHRTVFRLFGCRIPLPLLQRVRALALHAHQSTVFLPLCTALCAK
jgi:hypothetical protein